MEPSEELKRVLLRLYETLDKGDSEAFDHRISRHPGLLDIGTDPTEWWTDHDELVEVVRRQSAEMGGSMSLVPSDIQAWEEGTTGWVADRPVLELGDQRIPVRLTAVFHLERGDWKVVQFHLSAGVNNEELLGFTLTTTVGALAEAVERERPDVGPAAAPDGTVTILFTDIEDSAKLTERLGDLRWMKLLGEHNRLVREQLEDHGGFEVKSQGDGFMLVFASARRALLCAVGIQQAIQSLASDGPGAVRVRIGVHTGEAIKKAEDFYGKSVVLASRIAERAGGGQVLVSSLVRDLTESTGEFEFHDEGQVELKGLSGMHRLYELAWNETRET